MNCILISQKLKHKLFSQQVVAIFCKLPDFATSLFSNICEGICNQKHSCSEPARQFLDHISARIEHGRSKNKIAAFWGAYQGGQSLSERIFRHNLSRVWVGLVVLQWQYMCRLSWRQLVQLCSGHLLPPVSDNPGLRNHFLVHPRSCCTVIATPKDREATVKWYSADVSHGNPSLVWSVPVVVALC